ncbi:MAG TPA: hypothetical protein VJX66_32190 [Amycolatopsis sp.]|nr:hypothetical protein [Amycolatopsis sp.]
MSGQYYEETNSLDPDEDDDGGKWWQWLLYALLSFGLSGAAWWWLTQKEREGGRFKLWWVLALVYHFLGKVGVSAVLAAVGLLFLIAAVYQFAHRTREGAKA